MLSILKRNDYEALRQTQTSDTTLPIRVRHWRRFQYEVSVLHWVMIWV